MNKIIVVHSTMDIGGAETSLLGLLKAFDYKRNSVDLLLLNPVGELINLIPKEVNIIKYKSYKNLMIPIIDVLKCGRIDIALSRIVAKIKSFIDKKNLDIGDYGYVTKEYTHKYSLHFLPDIKGDYDIAISFIDPHYIIQNKIKAKMKLGWVHTDFSRIKPNYKVDYKMWNNCDYIVCVSQLCKERFDEIYPKLKSKSIVIENILSKEYIETRANEIFVNDEIDTSENTISFCSVGRFCEAKNFDNIPEICKYIIEMGFNIRWYLIGYGSDEELIRRKIREYGMENNVIILGKKLNPYPYIKKCDFYIQPSRYEGKAVTVREAQILKKICIIANYSTADSQINNGIDGVIAPLDNYKFALEVTNVLKNNELQNKIKSNLNNIKFENEEEINKIYKLMQGISI